MIIILGMLSLVFYKVNLYFCLQKPHYVHIMCKSVEYMARNIVMMNLFPTFIFCPFLASTTYHGNASKILSYYCYVLFSYTLICCTKSDRFLCILGQIYVSLTELPCPKNGLSKKMNIYLIWICNSFSFLPT